MVGIEVDVSYVVVVTLEVYDNLNTGEFTVSIDTVF